MLPRQLPKLLVDVSITIAAIASLYGVWMAGRAAFGFESRTTADVIQELRAEDIRDRSRDSSNSADMFGVKNLTETNTILLCSMVNDKLKYNSNLPCKRLLRERGLE